MSHVSKRKAAIGSLDGIKETCEALGLEFHEGDTKFRYYAGQTYPCEHRISVKGNKEAFEMGLTSNEDGTYSILWDSYGGGKGLVKVVGKNADHLMQEYGLVVSERHLRKKGFKVRRVEGDNGHRIVEAYS